MDSFLKKHFLGNKYLGITEYIASKFSKRQVCMLIYNKKLSVSPITTHLPINQVTKNINSKTISKKISIINSFYKKTWDFPQKLQFLDLILTVKVFINLMKMKE